jgi:hypothetical protein
MKHPTIEEYEEMDRIRFPFLSPCPEIDKLVRGIAVKKNKSRLGRPSKLSLRIARLDIIRYLKKRVEEKS